LLRKVIVGVVLLVLLVLAVVMVVGEDALEDIDSAVGLQAVSFGGVGGEGSLPA
jgi:hypothetical protein